MREFENEKFKVSLFVDDSQESRQAREILEDGGLPFEILPASGPKLPAVQVGSAMFYGVPEITQLASDVSTARKEQGQ